MKRITVVKTLLISALLPFLLVSCDKDAATSTTDQAVSEVVEPGSKEGKIIPNQYIVFMKESAIAPGISYLNGPVASREAKAEFMDERAMVITGQLQDFLAKQDINTNNVIAYYTSLVAGFAIKLNDEEFKRLSANKMIDLIEHDREESLPDFIVESTDGGAGRAQTTPCGISRAGGAANAGSDRWIWIIDSGIDLDHPDLNVVTNSTYSRSFVGGSANDCNGHGTHVAGTAAARNNSIGVVGVAAGAPVVSVRVFGCSGGSSSSTIISGIDHVGRYDVAGDVTNMSLGGYYGSNCSSRTPYLNPVRNLGNGGNRVAIAAGNSSGNTALYAPGCINSTNVYTVASMTCNRTWSSFSNYNMNPVDYIATGSSVYSTYLNGGYATLSGTSMATPHVAGIMQIRNNSPRTSGSVSNRGENYPIAVR